MAITVNSTKTFANYFPEYTADLTTRGVSNFSGDDEILLSCTSTSDSGDSTVIRKVPLSRLTELSSLLATTEHRGFISATEKGSLNMLSLASTEHAGLVPDTNGHLGDNVFLGTNENTGKPQWQTMGNHTASTSASGFLSASDKIKLDNIASSATRNTFSAINYPSTATQTPSFGESFKVWNVGQTTSGAINMATMALTIPNYLASTTSDGSRRGLVPGPTTAQIGDNYFLGTGSSGTPQWQNMSAHQASTQSSGFMSALDKIKLDNINLNILSGLTIESLPNESESNQYQNLNKQAYNNQGITFRLFSSSARHRPDAIAAGGIVMTVTHGSYINQILSLNNNSANVRLYTRNITKGSSWSSTNSTYGTWTSLIDGSTYADYSG